MRPSNDVWQGRCSYWQDAFIQQNLLLIGYTAWYGYLNNGRGILVCEMTDEISAAIDWQVEQVKFTRQFVSQDQISSDLQASKLKKTTIDRLVQAIATYDPTREILILIRGNGQLDINLLQLKITPPSCYEQIQRRWAEFQPDFLQS